MVRRLVMVRHGETDFNRERRVQGHLDVPLNATGMAQARAIAQRLASFPLVHCVASDLARAADTARQIAARHGLDVEFTPDLREAHLGVLQGRLYDESSHILRLEADDVPHNDIRTGPPGGESLLDVRRRAQRFVRQLTKRAPTLPDGDILIVGHGGSLRAVLAVVLGLPTTAAWAFRFHNCALTIVDWNPAGRSLLVCYNDSAHLVG